MRKSSRMAGVSEKNLVFADVLYECENSSPGARLSYNLRNRLEKFSIQDRSNIVNRTSGGCSPLFIVCRRGQTEIVEYLITRCKARIEQRGLYEVPDDKSTHEVTPLWCAAVSGKLKVVEILLKYGADINAVSDTGSTPVRSACFMTHFEVVKYLVEHKADINQPNYNGGTCLINSVQSSPLCEFLLKNGADVNARDIQNKTALHYAIQEHRLETTKLLLKNGANIYAKSRFGDDALQMACLKGAFRIFHYLTTNFTYSPEKLANAHELLGATYLDEHGETSDALRHWKEGLQIREKYGLFPKQPVLEPIENYRFQKEFETLEELENISGDLDDVRIQSLLIAERILGRTHKDTIFRLMYRGASYADTLRHQRCIYLWRRALEIRIKKDTILYTDTCFTAQALVRLMIDYGARSNGGNATDTERAQRFEDALYTYKLLTDDIDHIRDLLSIRPVFNRQADFFDKILKCITHLIYLLVENSSTNKQLSLVHRNVKLLVQKNLKTVASDDTLLHLCVSKQNVIRSSYFIDEEALLVFPHYNVIRLLLHSGASVNARNNSGFTPLHVTTNQLMSSYWHIKLLLDYGAHIDQPTASGMTSVNYICKHNRDWDYQIPVLKYMSLKCLCATVICRELIPFENQIPKTLVDFVRLHKMP